jgi:hypothetical protein
MAIDTVARVLSAWEECDKTDTVFILVCTVICWTIVPTVSSSTLDLPRQETVLIIG